MEPDDVLQLASALEARCEAAEAENERLRAALSDIEMWSSERGRNESESWYETWVWKRARTALGG